MSRVWIVEEEDDDGRWHPARSDDGWVFGAATEQVARRLLVRLWDTERAGRTRVALYVRREEP